MNLLNILIINLLLLINLNFAFKKESQLPIELKHKIRSDYLNNKDLEALSRTSKLINNETLIIRKFRILKDFYISIFGKDTFIKTFKNPDENSLFTLKKVQLDMKRIENFLLPQIIKPEIFEIIIKNDNNITVNMGSVFQLHTLTITSILEFPPHRFILNDWNNYTEKIALELHWARNRYDELMIFRPLLNFEEIKRIFIDKLANYIYLKNRYEKLDSIPLIKENYRKSVKDLNKKEILFLINEYYESWKFCKSLNNYLINIPFFATIRYLFLNSDFIDRYELRKSWINYRKNNDKEIISSIINIL